MEIDCSGALTPLAHGEVHLWRASLDGGLAPARLLSTDETEHAQRFRRDVDRERFIAARAWRRLLLAGYLGAAPEEVRFVQGPDGKPALASPGLPWLRFSASRSAGLAVLAVSRGREVGVDVERVNAGFPADAVVRRFFSAREQHLLSTLAPETRTGAFFMWWTLKEALVKAMGVGLRGPLPEFASLPLPGETLRVSVAHPSAPGSGTWSARAFDVGPGYAATASVQGDDVTIPAAGRPYPPAP